MIGQKEEKKLRCEAREQIVGPEIDPVFGARFGVGNEFFPYACAPYSESVVCAFALPAGQASKTR